MPFAGVSVVADGRLVQPSSPESAMFYPGSSAASRGSWYHLLVVEGYSRIKDLPNGKRIKTGSFKAGGYQWALKSYPNGDLLEDAGYISVFLSLDQDVAQPVKAHHHFSFIGEVGKQEPARVRGIKASSFHKKGYGFGLHRFMKREALEKSEHLKDDCFTIRCDFIIAEAAAAPLIEVPPPNLSEHLNHLFVTKVGVDVTFEVGHETFAAHRCVLASRSAVFMAELFGPMKEGIAIDDAIQIQDMEPNVFKALLNFVYTDLMPEMEVEGQAGEAVSKVTWLRHLLAAADRFDLQQLKSMCEERLSEHINLGSVTAILGLAAQHHCRGLKEACLEFLKVQSAAILEGVMATSDWQHISATDPSVLNELIAKLASKA
ncbi:BTB/POZ and MATH domain-containing protein 3-like [Triticum dicoccoides]|uniref:BTB/POZ and MATH domain-containing protein 3-like n=1 Tax=Triticum dicoccoides TaxID=85692 RepID=UPI00188E6DC5|nr:BTB/POZ and MATH domain-containing protein 3-like [Triticum dicoccoides]